MARVLLGGSINLDSLPTCSERELELLSFAFDLALGPVAEYQGDAYPCIPIGLIVKGAPNSISGGRSCKQPHDRKRYVYLLDGVGRHDCLKVLRMFLSHSTIVHPFQFESVDQERLLAMVPDMEGEFALRAQSYSSIGTRILRVLGEPLPRASRGYPELWRDANLLFPFSSLEVNRRFDLLQLFPLKIDARLSLLKRGTCEVDEDYGDD
jgi:hypothetical protein